LIKGVDDVIVVLVDPVSMILDGEKEEANAFNDDDEDDDGIGSKEGVDDLLVLLIVDLPVPMTLVLVIKSFVALVLAMLLDL